MPITITSSYLAACTDDIMQCVQRGVVFIIVHEGRPVARLAPFGFGGGDTPWWTAAETPAE
ncbi:hypothetical protein [Marinactinospora rubrisoli]|uniref:Type II toxin-antitoxin system Phd/YefM family antitoxin n=1 Tax=Marinactinospora rubrisoli TaxID=2715399 RepID=A0ABW2KJB9_9ACTN